VSVGEALAFGHRGAPLGRQRKRQARDRAAKARDKQDIAYAIPKEGSLLWIDVAAVPKDAPDPAQALSFLDFMLEPKVAAASSELTGYANANTAATALLPKDISGNPLIYPPADVRARFYTITAGDAEQTTDKKVAIALLHGTADADASYAQILDRRDAYAKLGCPLLLLRRLDRCGHEPNPARAAEAEQDRIAARLYARRGTAPWPGEPKVSLPGSALARAMKSASVLSGELLGMAIATGYCTTSETGSKSLTG